jgi:uncharacterized membrane protein
MAVWMVKLVGFAKHIVRILLGLFMTSAGIGHFNNTASFLAQVPPFLPAPEMIVYVSGVVEILLGLGLIFLFKYKQYVGIALAAFFVIIFPGNISQYLTETSAFGLETDTQRLVRLLFQPVLIFAAIWSTSSWSKLKTINPFLNQKHR